jgi:hypothetical protein
VPSAFNLEAGYVLDALEQRIAQTLLVCPNGFRNVYWAYDLSDALAKATVVDLFEPSTEQSKSNVLPFRPKKRDGDELKSDEQDA